MSKPVIFTISAAWDPEASVWSGHCDDIPAAADAPTLDELFAKISAMALDLLSRSAEALLHPLNQWTKSSKLSSPRGTTRTVNIHEAKTHLSRLVDRAAKGEPFIIAKAGKPMARLVPIPSAERRVPKLGTMRGKIWMADDWDSPETNEAIWEDFWKEMEEES